MGGANKEGQNSFGTANNRKTIRGGVGGGIIRPLVNKNITL